MTHTTLITLLDALETELSAMGKLTSAPPAAEAFDSTVPFCMDCMPFTAWLQWLFIPRMRAIIDAGAQLPSGANIKPYAEEALLHERCYSTALLTLIEQIDDHLA